MSGNKNFRELVEKLYESDLHFHMSETPFSAQILIRKKLLKNSKNSASTTASTVATSTSEMIDSLKNQIMQLEKNIEESSEVNNMLQNKLGKAEAHALKVYEDKKTEVDTLKITLKKSDQEARKLKKELEDEQRITKEKEKMLKKLENKCENLTTNIKNVRTELQRVKNESKKLLKNKIKSIPISDVVETENADEHDDLNRNIPPETKLASCSSSLTKNDLPGTPSKTPCTASHDRLSSPSPRSPPVTPPRALPIAAAAAGLPSMASSNISSSSQICSHSLQCVIRQPMPPPPDKCTILVHDGSKYHEHMDSQAGVPYQLGGTHEYCMRIDYENYGCEDCIWNKKWGELHGFPDINPWTFQEHRQPLTYL